MPLPELWKAKLPPAAGAGEGCLRLGDEGNEATTSAKGTCAPDTICKADPCTVTVHWTCRKRDGGNGVQWLNDSADTDSCIAKQ